MTGNGSGGVEVPGEGGTGATGAGPTGAASAGGAAGSGAGGAAGSGASGPRRPHRRRISPGVVFLAIALIGTVAFGLYAVTVRDASQIPLLAAGAAALGIVFMALAVYALRGTWRAGLAGRNGRSIALGCGGGIAFAIGAGCLAGAVILFLLSRPPA